MLTDSLIQRRRYGEISHQIIGRVSDSESYYIAAVVASKNWALSSELDWWSFWWRSSSTKLTHLLCLRPVKLDFLLHKSLSGAKKLLTSKFSVLWTVLTSEEAGYYLTCAMHLWARGHFGAVPKWLLHGLDDRIFKFILDVFFKYSGLKT